VTARLPFRKDLYAGTAQYYDRFRPPYPSVLLDDLRARVPIDATSRVVDLACGTGQIAFALAEHVDKIWAVDQEPEFIEFGKRKAQRLDITNINWVAATAEDVPLEGAFELVAIGNAFHRLDRDAVARRLVPYLAERGCVALLWGGAQSIGDRPWQRVLHERLERWQDTLGSRDRVPVGWEVGADPASNKQVLERAGLVNEGRFEFSVVERWTIDSLIGNVYSTSFLSRVVVGNHAKEFESDLRSQLLGCEPEGVFEQDLPFAYDLARRPA
jgi:SAM-dependent methyltransferase